MSLILPWDSFSTVGWCHLWMWTTQTRWKALKWLPDRVDWTRLIQARVEVDPVQTATQICVPSVRVAVATEGFSIWLLSHFYKLPLLKPCLLPGVLMHSSHHSGRLACRCLSKFISNARLPDNILLNDSWPEKPREVAASPFWGHTQSLLTSSLKSSGCSSIDPFQA